MIYDLLASDKKNDCANDELKAIESAGLILRNMEFKFSEDSKEKSSSNCVPPIFLIITI